MNKKPMYTLDEYLRIKFKNFTPVDYKTDKFSDKLLCLPSKLLDVITKDFIIKNRNNYKKNIIRKITWRN